MNQIERYELKCKAIGIVTLKIRECKDKIGILEVYRYDGNEESIDIPKFVSTIDARAFYKLG